jgi:hypothetical protein
MKRTVIAIATMFVAVLATASPALADHGGDIVAPDNADQAVESISLTTKGKAAVAHGRAELNRSDINTVTGTSDLHVYDGSYDTSWYGHTQCTSTNWWNGRCDHYTVKFNTRNMGSRSTYYWESLGCHEFGHTGSLGHRKHANDGNDNSCMRVEIWPKYLDTHDIDAINANV